MLAGLLAGASGLAGLLGPDIAVGWPGGSGGALDTCWRGEGQVAPRAMLLHGYRRGTRRADSGLQGDAATNRVVVESLEGADRQAFVFA